MTAGQWIGQWLGQWFGSGEEAPAVAMSGQAALSVGATANASARGALSGQASIALASTGTLSQGGVSPAWATGTAGLSFGATGTLTASTPAATGQFWADGFWSAGFWSDGFWGVLDKPYNGLLCHQQAFVRTLLGRTYVTTTVEYIVAHAQRFNLSVRDSVEAIKLLTTLSDLYVMPEVKRDVLEEKSHSARKEGVDSHIFALTRTNDLNIICSHDYRVLVTRCKQHQFFVNTRKTTCFVVEYDKL